MAQKVMDFRIKNNNGATKSVKILDRKVRLVAETQSELAFW